MQFKYTTAYCTDGGSRLSAPHPSRTASVRKKKTQLFERKHLHLRTQIKRLARQTICLDLLRANARFGDWSVVQSVRVWLTDLDTNNKSITLPI